MKYKIEVAGIGYENKDGTARSFVVKKYLSNDTSQINVELRRHGGNKHDRNAVGIYISKTGFWGFDSTMIGFVPRDQAREISPMIKAGGTILEASVVNVWLPTRSEKARPCVTLSISTSWEESDVTAEMKRMKENKIKKQLDRKTPQQHESSKSPVLMFLQTLFGFCKRLISK